MKYFKLPDLGEGLNEAEIVQWHIKEGEDVKVDQLMVSVKPAKAIVDVPSPQAGTVAAIFAQVGDVIHLGEPLMEYAGVQDDSGTVVGHLAVNENTAVQDSFIVGSAHHSHGGGAITSIKATPSVRALAKRLAVDISHINGSGVEGQVSSEDVEKAAQLNQEKGHSEVLKGVRKSMARTMTKSHEQVVPVTLFDEVDVHLWENEDASISLVKHYELLELAALRNENRFLGIEMALDTRNNDLGVLGYMLRNAPNLEVSLDLVQRYVKLVAPNSTVSIISEEDHTILTYKIGGITADLSIQSLEMTVAQYVRLIRTILDDESWQPVRMYFEHGAPTKDQLKDFPFDCELIFNHFFSGICFNSELMAHANQHFDPQLLALLESQVQQSAQSLLSSDSLIDHIRLLITSNLGHTEVTADSIASELLMSRRTLNRRLNENGTTFNSLRENIVFHMAKESLCNTRISITELAQKLGYSDSSAFNRAFKRNLGLRPLQYRKEHSQV